MKIFTTSKLFPQEEKYSLTDQIRRSSISVCTNTAEAFRKRRHEKAFVSKLNDAEGEAAETQVWLQFTVKCNYLKKEQIDFFCVTYDNIMSKRIIMSRQPEKWSLLF